MKQLYKRYIVLHCVYAVMFVLYRTDSFAVLNVGEWLMTFIYVNNEINILIIFFQYLEL